MKRFVFVIITISLLTLSASSQNKITKIDGVEYLFDLIVIKQDGKIGLKSENNNTLVEPIYEKIEFDDKNQVYKAYLSKKEFVIFDEGFSKQKFNDRLQHIEEYEDFLKAKTSRGYGIIDASNSYGQFSAEQFPACIVPLVFKSITYNSERLHPAMGVFVVETKSNKTGVFGYGIKNMLIDTIYEEIKLLNEEAYGNYDVPVLVKKNDKYGLLTSNRFGFDVFLKTEFDEISDLGNDNNEGVNMYKLSINGKEGIVRFNSDTIIPFVYNSIQWDKKADILNDDTYLVPAIKNNVKGSIVIKNYRSDHFFVEEFSVLEEGDSEYGLVKNNNLLAIYSTSFQGLSQYIPADKIELYEGDYIITHKNKSLNLYRLMDLFEKSTAMPLHKGFKNIDEIRNWIENN